MVEELKQEKGDLNVCFVDFSRDSQRKHGATPVRDNTDFVVIESKWSLEPGTYPESWGDDFRHLPAWDNVAVILDGEAKVTSVFNFKTGFRGIHSLKKGKNYRNLKNCILKAYKQEEKVADETEKKQEVTDKTPAKDDQEAEE